MFFIGARLSPHYFLFDLICFALTDTGRDKYFQQPVRYSECPITGDTVYTATGKSVCAEKQLFPFAYGFIPLILSYF